ncbi:MAG: biotin/lipoyl-binding protein [Patescibacteria group bacterium]
MVFSILQRTSILAAAAVVAMASIAVFLLWHPSPRETATVTRGDLYEDITLAGALVDAKTVDLSFSVEGSVRAVVIREGQKVSAGETLAELSDANIRAQLKQYEAKRELAQLKLSQLLAGTKKEEVALAESNVASARVALESTRATLENIRLKAAADLAEHYARANDYADTVVLNAENAMHALAEIYDDRNKFRDTFIIPESKARSDAEWQVMFARTSVFNTGAERARLALDMTSTSTDMALAAFKLNLEVLRASLQKTADVLETGMMTVNAPDISGYRSTMAIQRSVINATQTAILTFEQDIAQQKLDNRIAVTEAENAMAVADIAYTTLQSDLALKRATPSRIDIAVAQAEIKEYNASLDALQEQLARTVLSAPADGVIGRVAAHAGSTLRAYAPVVEFTTAAGARFEASVEAATAGKIHGGDTVVIRIPGQPDEVAGSVLVVGGQSVVVVAIATDGTPAWPLGTTAEIVVHAIKKRNVLFVDRSFITEENNGHFARLQSRDGALKVPVLTGDVWQERIEIAHGLAEGDIVVK